MIIRAGLLTLVLSVSPVSEPEWHSTEKNPVTGEACCAEQHCKEIDASRVRPDVLYFVIDGRVYFPREQALPSPDEKYRICISNGKMRCFFYPTPGTS